MSEENNNKKAPVFKVKYGVVEVALWENEGKDGKDPFLTATFNRSYKDKDDNWQTTTSMRVNDLPVLMMAVGEAFKHAKTPKAKGE